MTAKADPGSETWIKFKIIEKPVKLKAVPRYNRWIMWDWKEKPGKIKRCNLLKCFNSLSMTQQGDQ